MIIWLTVLVTLIILFLVVGWLTLPQDPNTVWVRNPGSRRFGKPMPLKATAESEWEYAIMAENAYRDHWGHSQKTKSFTNLKHPLVELSVSKEGFLWNRHSLKEKPIPLPGWYRWMDFPETDPSLGTEAGKQKLYFEVWQRGHPGKEVVIVFRGTVAKYWQNWIANFRWIFHISTDAYDVTKKQLASDFANRIQERIEDQSLSADVKIVAVGHSLGGGLAQQLAYALPTMSYCLKSTKSPIPSVTEVYAFDSSPVTGYAGVRNTEPEQLILNIKGLQTHRIYERGEILAYLRLLVSYFIPPRAANPAIDEIRYNFSPFRKGLSESNPIAQHSMVLLMRGILDAVSHAPRAIK